MTVVGGHEMFHEWTNVKHTYKYKFSLKKSFRWINYAREIIKNFSYKAVSHVTVTYGRRTHLFVAYIVSDGFL